MRWKSILETGIAAGKKFLSAIAIKKGAEAAESSGILSTSLSLPALIGITFLVSMFLFAGSSLLGSTNGGNLFVLQGVDPAYANTGSNGTGTGGPILLIAGHSYEPYCEQASNECRVRSASGYHEPDETRALVKLIRDELQNLNVKVDIANELLAPGDDRMNSSFYVESLAGGTNAFNSINWSQYKYVLEVHFNAVPEGEPTTAAGPLLVKPSGYSTDLDDKIVQAVSNNTNKSRRGDSNQSLNDISYFSNLGIPITYLETEFFDNKDAMDKYSSVKGQIAKDIAQVIKDAYGQSVDVSGERAAIVERAKAQLGKDYEWAAVGPNSFDCSGLVSYALSGEYTRLGTTDTFMGWPETNDPQPGDICVNSEHTGIYIGNGEMIHAADYGIGVIIGPVQSGMKYVVYPNLAGS